MPKKPKTEGAGFDVVHEDEPRPEPSRNLLVLQGQFANAFEDVVALVSSPPPENDAEALAQYNAELEARMAEFAITTETAEKKVDGIAVLTRASKKLAEYHRDEAEFHRGRAKALEGTAKRVLDWVGTCMAMLNVREFLGRTSKLRMQDNPPSLIEHPEDVRPLPSKYCDFTNDADWEAIAFMRETIVGLLDPEAEPLTLEGVNAIAEQVTTMHDQAAQRRMVPNKKLIKDAIKAGEDVPGYEVVVGTHVRVY